MKKYFLILLACGWTGHASAAVILSLINPLTGNDTVTVQPGGTFSLIYRVSGLDTVSLDSFDTELDALPAGVSLVSFTSLLPPFPQWFYVDLPAELKFGGAGDAITGTYDLLTANFSVSAGAVLGSFSIEFVPENPASMQLREIISNPSPPPSLISVPFSFTPESASLLIIPEPAVTVLLLAAALISAVFWYRAVLLRRSRPIPIRTRTGLR